MEKDKVIEEMAKEISESNILCKNCGDYGDTYCTEAIANTLYNAGYRKIPEDSVVISKEQYRELKGRAEEVFNEMIERMKAEVKIAKKMGIVKGSKETAEKFAKGLRNFIYLCDDLNLNGDTYEKISNKMDELIEQCGVRE